MPRSSPPPPPALALLAAATTLSFSACTTRRPLDSGTSDSSRSRSGAPRLFGARSSHGEHSDREEPPSHDDRREAAAEEPTLADRRSGAPPAAAYLDRGATRRRPSSDYQRDLREGHDHVRNLYPPGEKPDLRVPSRRHRRIPETRLRHHYQDAYRRDLLDADRSKPSGYGTSRHRQDHRKSYPDRYGHSADGY